MFHFFAFYLQVLAYYLFNIFSYDLFDTLNHLNGICRVFFVEFYVLLYNSGIINSCFFSMALFLLDPQFSLIFFLSTLLLFSLSRVNQQGNIIQMIKLSISNKFIHNIMPKYELFISSFHTTVFVVFIC